MPRNRFNVEFFRFIRQLNTYRFRSTTAFAKACGLNLQNTSAYLNGKKTPGPRVLKAALQHIYGGTHPNVLMFALLRELNSQTYKTTSAFAAACGLKLPNTSAYLRGAKVPGKKVLSRTLARLYRGRHPNVQFFNLLMQLGSFQTQTVFAQASGLQVQNTSAYLSGSKIPRRRVLSRVLTRLYGWTVLKVTEMAPLPSPLSQLPQLPGVYVLYDSSGAVLYLGKATSFRSEIQQTLGRNVPRKLRLNPTLAKRNEPLRKLTTMHSLYRIDDPGIRHKFEGLLLRIVPNQTHNRNL